MKLIDLLGRIDKNTNHFWYSKKKWHTLSDISRLDLNLKQVKEEVTGHNVALKISTPIDLAKLLIHLDGAVPQIFLSPKSIEVRDSEELLRASKSEYLISDEAGSLTIKKINDVGAADEHKNGLTEWLIPTSGTTGTPKLISHNTESLTRHIKVSAHIPQFTWGLLYDLNRFAGLQVFCHSLFTGSPLVFQSDSNNLDETLKTFVDADVDALSASPTLWRKILMLPNKLDLKQMTLGGEIADQNILSALTKKYPAARLVHIYASTEIGVGFSVSDHKEGFPEKFVTKGYGTTQLKISSDGHLLIKKNTFTDYIDTGDLVKKVVDRYLFLGRANGSINVGGDKVIPEEIENVIRQVNEVADVAVYGRPNPFSGAIVACDIILKPEFRSNPDAAKASIHRVCREKLVSFKVPAIINFVGELGISKSGKILRRAK